jgi:hypothetical protein
MRELYAQRAREQEKLKKAKLYCIICDKELNGGQEIVDHAINFIRNPDFESILKVHSIFVNEKKEISRSEFDYFNILLDHSKWRMNGYVDLFYQELKKSICEILLNPRTNRKIYYNKPDEDLEFWRKKNETSTNEIEIITKNQDIVKATEEEPPVKKKKKLIAEEKSLLEIEAEVKSIKNDFGDIKNMLRPYEKSPKKLISKLKVLKNKLDGLVKKNGLSEDLSQTVRNLRDAVNNEIHRKSSSNKTKSSKKRGNETVSVYIESLVFEDGKVELMRKEGSVKFGLHSSVKALNDFKNEYFGEQVFKFYLKNNQLIKEESPGYKLLEEKIKSYRIAKKSNKKTVEPINIINKKLNGNELIDILNNQAFKNIYLKEAAQRLKMKTDFVVAFEENNNGTKEQGLLFVFKRTIRPGMEKSFILYENSREDRAAYLFRVRENYSESFIKDLLTFAQSDQRNKRDSLLREKYNDLKIDRVKCWKVIKHNSAEHYLNELDRWV